MTFEVPYSLLPGLERTGVLAPILPVTFIKGATEFPTFALVDSGAESGVISTVIADELGIKWRELSKQKGFGMGSSFLFHTYKNLKISIFDYEFTMDINIVEGVYAFKCILGRKDLFKNAKVTFEGYNNKFSIEFKGRN